MTEKKLTSIRVEEPNRMSAGLMWKFKQAIPRVRCEECEAVIMLRDATKDEWYAWHNIHKDC